MPATRINLDRRRLNSTFLPLIEEHPETIRPLLLLRGGRGSGKSRGVAQKVVLSLLGSKIRFLLVRKVRDTIRHSQFQEIKDVVEEWGLSEFFTFNDQRLSITTTNGSLLISKGLDRPEKIKSVASVDEVWVEEATELTTADWTTLTLSIRGRTTAGKIRRIIATFNPVYGHWLKEMYFHDNGEPIDDPDVYHHYSTYKQNRFLGKDFERKLLWLKKNDPDLYKINALGLWVAIHGTIYKKWNLVSDKDWPKEKMQKVAGLDIGYVDPMSLHIYERLGNKIFVREVVYQTDLTTGQLIEKMEEYGFEKWIPIYVDSARPDVVAELREAGYNPFFCDKKSITAGINTVKEYELNIHENCVGMLAEIAQYKWSVGKDGKKIDRPVDLDNHAMDDMRYALHTHTKLFWRRERKSEKKPDRPPAPSSRQRSNNDREGGRSKRRSINKFQR